MRNDSPEFLYPRRVGSRRQEAMASLRLLGCAVVAFGCMGRPVATHGQSGPTVAEVRAAMKKAAGYYHGSVARHGGYVYYYSPDLSKRLGEGVAGGDQIWVQEPGTPTVGLAYLAAFQATDDRFYLDAAIDTAKALIHGQLESGGWTNWVDFDPKSPRVGRYRNGKGKRKGKNFSSLDDGISQVALQFLMKLDKETRFQNQAVHEAAGIALDALLAVQFPNGAFPQGWEGARVEPPATLAVDKKANYPPYDWRSEGRIKEYWHQYTLNDGLAETVSETLMVAHRVYGREDCLAALKRLGDFLVLAQMPKPQPGWAQQYNYQMQPIWARKFEPPALAGRESEGVIASLMRIAFYCRDKHYLEPVPRALAYLKKSQLPGGKLARYYELRTNRPLYMERRGKVYTLTHDDSNLPGHYGWQTPSRLESLEAALRSINAGGGLPENILPAVQAAPSIDGIIRELDEKGRWVSTFSGERLSGQPKFKQGEKYLHSGVFSRNLELLSAYLAAKNPGK